MNNMCGTSKTGYNETNLLISNEGYIVYDEGYTLSDNERKAIDYLKKQMNINETYSFVSQNNTTLPESDLESRFHKSNDVQLGFSEYAILFTLVGFMLEAFIAF